MTDESSGGAAPGVDHTVHQGVDQGGDPVCWLSRVCPECGLFAVREPPTTCQRCGAAIAADDLD